MARPFANYCPQPPELIKEAEPTPAFRTARRLSGRYAAHILKVADRLGIPAKAADSIEYLRDAINDEREPIGPALHAVTYHWPVLAEEAAKSHAHTIPVGAIVQRETGSLRYRVVAHTVEMGRGCVVVERCDGAPVYWESARKPIYREIVMGGLVEVVHG